VAIRICWPSMGCLWQVVDLLLWLLFVSRVFSSMLEYLYLMDLKFIIFFSSKVEDCLFFVIIIFFSSKVEDLRAQFILFSSSKEVSSW